MSLEQPSEVDQLLQRRQELNDLVATFNTAGWTIYTKDLQTLRSVLRDTAVADCETGEQWAARRAQIQHLDVLLSYQTNSEAELEAIEAELLSPTEPDDYERNPLED